MSDCQHNVAVKFEPVSDASGAITSVAVICCICICDECEMTFAKGWSDEESQAELDENFPWLTKQNAACVCDDCYRKCMGLASIDAVS